MRYVKVLWATIRIVAAMVRQMIVAGIQMASIERAFHRVVAKEEWVMVELKSNWEIRREIDEACLRIVGLWITILLFVTCPIWGFPYVLYKRSRG